MRIIFLLSIICFLFSCSQKKEKLNVLEEGDIEKQMILTYNTGIKAFEDGDVLYATKMFKEAELLFPQSVWAPRSSLMSAYAYYSEGYYNDSIIELKRYIKLYSKSKNIDYANYLIGVNYYESIVDEKKDLKPLEEAINYFNIVIKDFPETDFALDARYKLELINDLLAAKEIYIARHYMNKQQWIAAINRLKTIVKDYETSIYVEEALHRLVEINYIIGNESEAKKYASTLGFNYSSGDWYKQSYLIFNEDYYLENRKKSKQDKKKLIEKIKSFF